MGIALEFPNAAINWPATILVLKKDADQPESELMGYIPEVDFIS